MNIIRKTQFVKVGMASILLAFVAVCGMTAPALAQGAAGDAKNDVCEGITAGSGSTGSCRDSGDDIDKVIRLVIGVISVIAGVVAVIMIIIGGFRYITSDGDSSKIAGAKSAIIYAIVGIVIVALAQIIVRFVLKETTAPPPPPTPPGAVMLRALRLPGL